MSSSERVLLLIGSARRPRSTSEALGAYLLNRLGEREFEAETVLLHRALRSPEARETLLAASDRADVIVLAFPLYVDSLPALVVRALELINAHRAAGRTRPRQRLLAIVNCGFPEAHQNQTAIAICRRFAQESGFEWIGGLALGGGGVVAGRELVETGGAARFVIEALDLAADAIAGDRPVPSEAVEAMATPAIPHWAYRLMGWFGWRMQAHHNGVRPRLAARPYEV